MDMGKQTDDCLVMCRRLRSNTMQLTQLLYHLTRGTHKTGSTDWSIIVVVIALSTLLLLMSRLKTFLVSRPVLGCLLFLICIEFVYLYFPVLFCLSVSVKWLAVKTASEMTYTVSGGALNSTPTNQSSSLRLSLLSLLTNTLPGPSASEVTTLWCYPNLFIIIIIIICLLQRLRADNRLLQQRVNNLEKVMYTSAAVLCRHCSTVSITFARRLSVS